MYRYLQAGILMVATGAAGGLCVCVEMKEDLGSCLCFLRGSDTEKGQFWQHMAFQMSERC